jgi:UDP-N-acetylmuramoyl-tripeptide--D-alanyl-D-alanine ligase
MWNNKNLNSALKVKIELNIPDSEINIDSRVIKKNDIFLALQGENHDGHAFLKQAQENGAIAAIVSKKNEAIEIPQIIVDDTYQALLELAKFKRKIYKNTIIAITGSVGKTSYKDGLAFILADYGITYKTSGNFNNHIGLPLCLANLDLHAKFAVFELGMNHSGEIKFLSNLLKANLALITRITEAHIENFVDINGIIAAKAEICYGLSPDSTLILNKNDNNYKKLQQHILAKYNLDKKNIKTFGNNNLNDLIIKELAYKEHKLYALITINNQDYKLNFSLFNKGVAEILCSILLVTTELNLDPLKACKKISEITASEGRGKITEIKFNEKKITLINDSYNANFDSMKAAIETLNIIAAKNNSRKIAIIGDMLELGANTLKFHLDLKEILIANKIDKIISVGEYMKKLYIKLPHKMQLQCYNVIPRDIYEICSFLEDNDVILVKSSHGVKTSIIAQKLLELDNAL